MDNKKLRWKAEEAPDVFDAIVKENVMPWHEHRFMFQGFGKEGICECDEETNYYGK